MIPDITNAMGCRPGWGEPTNLACVWYMVMEVSTPLLYTIIQSCSYPASYRTSHPEPCVIL